MALLAAGSALVAGSHSENDMQMQTVRVARAFYYQGKPIKVGEVVSLPRVFALEMIAANKAEKVGEEAARPAPAGKPAGGAADKGASHAR